ncbi:MAG: endonuclease/exonuclease/phosphatase family protein [Candidatus Hodarchaeota archaeon]
MVKKNILCLFLMIVVIFIGSCERGVYEKETDPNEFSFLIYNVAGLPQRISSSDPRTNIPKIAVKFNLFDIVLVQEDFFYHYFMRYGDGHPYESEHDYCHGTLGDGLNRFSYCEFTDHARITWDECYGYLDHASDCLTPKGFSVATHEISPDIFIDIYNLHMDAGSDQGDYDARSVGVDQLIEKILTFSDGNLVIVAGDFNMCYSNPNDNANLERLASGTQLIDSCIELGIDDDRVDKIFYRSSDSINLTPESYTVETEVFANENGEPLSDHEAVSVLFRWEEI